MLKYWRRHQWIVFCSLLFSAVLVLAQLSAVYSEQSLLKRLDGILYDSRLTLTLPYRAATDLPVVIVDIDEKSLQQVGRWPWSRQLVAQMLEQLTEAGASVVAFDVIFSEPERNPVQQVLQGAKQQLSAGMTEELQQLAPALDADQHFANSLENKDVVLGFLFQQEQLAIGQLPESYVLMDTEASQSSASHFEGYVANTAVLQQHSSGTGFINSSPDPDGFIRQAALLIRYQDQVYPSLALEAARLYALANELTVETAPLEQINTIVGVTVGNTRINTDLYGRVLIPYRGPARSFPYISASDVLHGQVDKTLLKDAIVFVGTSAVGHADLRSTPVGVQYPGVEVHANVFEGLIYPELIHSHPDWAEALVFLFLVVLGLLMSLTFPALGPVSLALSGSGLLLLTLGGNLYCWQVLKLDLPLTSSLLLILGLTLLNLIYGFFGASQQKARIKSIFDQYVPPAHIDEMLNHPESVSLDGKRKEMSVLFSDIRGFTSLSEKLSATELKSLLNRYFSPITKTIFEHQGTIDKYVGDMVMAFWNAPLDVKDHAELAVKAGFSMLKVTDELSKSFVSDGLPAIDIGVGINTGEMNVGDMGSEYRRAYTVLGDAVNLGSRLESLTKYYGVRFLVSQSTVQQCQNIIFRSVDKVKVKGKTEAVAIYEPVDASLVLNPDLVVALQQHEQALLLYSEQNWADAEVLWASLHQRYSDKLYSLYLERLAHYRQHPPGADWDGVYTHAEK
ncbi:adenylate/guanylate cyclase domain-containing protein [Rheinheimera sp. 1928-s]|uniref:CHASE2 domain-containing protein n=1 Tax=Rheinheimera sp. 1928-s TaxID=3033803 RepID=UPI002637F47A|nr:adenylate/guanylate cyclase domain-containing protein [Rheinheimera sp. 1928-s]MDF3124960.1 adenylate/guanylate cyclase domain-containing protein [Rheinheimera sp. 1928-s]